MGRRSDGTRWTNEQLLYHMLFGYIVVLALLPLVRLFGRLPPGVSRTWVRLLNASTGPFDVINYWGAAGGARVFGHRRMGAKFDRTITPCPAGWRPSRRHSGADDALSGAVGSVLLRTR
ncbi:hypothetical protein OG585_44260 [Streptomyces sp. NBC_01340]|uniref:hypothetical protein n=1 Tax=unclassified Streptomyces TaxID=2593676 RepID=UPI0022503739|nr:MULTISPECIES: hypothetical protein [unclassified Streptomyces]MCX4594979.1 hypothetical protein [Streptomyces sp. NBC_01549]WSI43533.1 hypothetical protein OG585_44260 [Streptomyces sp. NBC_01340]